MDEKDEILAGLEPMFTKARADGLWFYSPYAGTWFSPDELEAEQREGRFVWGAANWTLRNPYERLGELNRSIAATEAERARLIARMQCHRATPHASDCSAHNEPAYPAGPCDCGATP